MIRPTIDHTLLSPSGRASKRARMAALRREAARLFPPGYWDDLRSVPQPSEEERARSQAARLREMADRGMSPRKFRREAAAIEAALLKAKPA